MQGPARLVFQFPLPATDARIGFDGIKTAIGSHDLSCDGFGRIFSGDDIDHGREGITAIEGRLTSFENLNSFNIIQWQVAQIKITADTGGIINRYPIYRDQGMFNSGTAHLEAFIFSGIAVGAGNKNAWLLW